MELATTVTVPKGRTVYDLVPYGEETMIVMIVYGTASAAVISTGGMEVVV